MLESIGISSKEIDTMPNPILENYASTFEEEITALQQELQASDLIKFKELTRIRQEFADQELLKVREVTLRYQPARKQPPTRRTPTYVSTSIGPRISAGQSRG